MCTLTIIPATEASGGVWRLAFNRDEQRTRAAGTEPRLVDVGGRRAAHPVDATAGGTWIATTDAGLALATLNRNEPGLPDGRAPGASRGALILALLEAETLDDAAARAATAATAVTRGFRLVATDGARVLEVTGGGDAPATIAIEPLVRPFLRASSGLGDALVGPPRAELFAATVLRAPPDAWPAAQTAFHDHAWSDRRHLSVRMDRDEARTVSRTFIEVARDAIRMRHANRTDRAPDARFDPEHTIDLPRR
ncbi:MAG: hypothetical protein RI967_857 [Planctomycetota bacterium]